MPSSDAEGRGLVDAARSILEVNPDRGDRRPSIATVASADTDISSGQAELLEPDGESETLEERMERFRQRKARKKAERAERTARGLASEFGSSCSLRTGRHSEGSENARRPSDFQTDPDASRLRHSSRTLSAHMRKYVSAGNSVSLVNTSQASASDPQSFESQCDNRVRSEDDFEKYVPMQPSTGSPGISSKGGPVKGRSRLYGIRGRLTIHGLHDGTDTADSYNHMGKRERLDDEHSGSSTCSGRKQSSDHNRSGRQSPESLAGDEAPALASHVVFPHGSGWYELPASEVSQRSIIGNHWQLSMETVVSEYRVWK